MGILFRDARHEGNLFFGKRTVKEGECLGYWDLQGRYHVKTGPKRHWFFLAKFRFMDRHVADGHQYLVVQHRDGTKEHRRGPVAMFMDPVQHVAIRVQDAVTVDAFEVVVVYTEDKGGEVQRSIIKGPTVFVPAVNQWLHTFKWHGSSGRGDDWAVKVPGALRFTKLACIPDQMYFDAQGVRTSDDACLTVKMMLFYELADLEVMLNNTHDPIADFINALHADLITHGSRHTFESFVSNAQQLCELSTFPVLLSRAAAIGYKISKVVYRGYSASNNLQELCDRAIRTRMELRLKQEQHEQDIRVQELQLRSVVQRGAEERAQATREAEHKLQLKAAEAQARLAQQQAEIEQAHAKDKARADAALKYLSGLKELGVELTPMLVAAGEPKPDRVLQLVGLPQGTALHAHLDQGLLC